MKLDLSRVMKTFKREGMVNAILFQTIVSPPCNLITGIQKQRMHNYIASSYYKAEYLTTSTYT